MLWCKRDVLQVGLSFHKIGPEIVDDPVGEGLGVSAALSGFLKIVAQRYVIDKHLRIAIRQLVLIHETLLAVQGKFNDTLLNLFKPFFGRLKRYEVRAWKIAIVMGILLGSHALCDTCDIIPSSGFLVNGLSISDGFELPRDFILEGPSYAAEAVHVFNLNFGSQGRASFGTHTDIHITADHAFFHVTVADLAIDKNILERIEIGMGHVGTGDIGF